MLTSLIRLPTPTSPSSPEDIFSTAIGLIFTDDLRNQHGDPGSSIIYKSRAHGDLTLHLSDPETEDGRRLFAHYLWNAGVLMAELIGGGTADVGAMWGRGGRGGWSVRGERVLELGAGTGLAGIVGTLSGAREVVVSDYPAVEILANIRVNMEKNVPKHLQAKISVHGHEWGNLTDPLAMARKHAFTRVLAADCLWMPWQHESLVESMLHFLSFEEGARVWVIAGFHTGRAKLAPFFDVVVDKGLEIEDIWERDCDGREREWVKERDGGREDVGERNKWLVIAVLRRKELSSPINTIEP